MQLRDPCCPLKGTSGPSPVCGPGSIRLSRTETCMSGYRHRNRRHNLPDPEVNRLLPGISGLHSRLPRGVRPRLEGKPRTPLSSRVATRVSWSPLSGLKGVQPPLPFGERTRDCSPGHAGKEGPQLARTGASQGFPRAAAPVGVFSRGTTRISGSLSCGAREVRSPCAWRGGARPGSRVTGGD